MKSIFLHYLIFFEFFKLEKQKCKIYSLIVFCLLGSGCATPSWKPTHELAKQGFFDRFKAKNASDQNVSDELISKSDDESPSSSSLYEDLKMVKEETNQTRKVKTNLHWPLTQIKITSKFGKRGRSFHAGIDLKARVGTPVLAAQSGKVLYAGSKIRGYGRIIVLRHSHEKSNEISTIYAHNSKLLVRAGQLVTQGQKIALSGNSGKSTGPHLHFEIREGVASLDPLQILPEAPVFVASPEKKSSETRLAKRSLTSKISKSRVL